ncbi:MAG: radical SAM protein [Deltaproteobacteria bacterium]|nr:radical SAM protein [Deltaproteobacteria bacterium]
MAEGSRYREVGASRRRILLLKEALRRGLDWKFWIYRLKFRYAPRYDVITRFPTHLDIETTDACNLKCIMCVHGTTGVPDTGYIDMGFAKRLIDEGAAHGLYSIKFNWRGEPLLHPGLAELVAYAKKKKILEVQFNTNGIPLTERRVRELIEAGLDRIIFSMDGASKETYERIRVGAKFETLVRNVRRFYEIREEMGRKKPFIRVQMVRTKDNKDETDALFDMWEPFVDDIRVNDVSDRGQGDHLAVGDQVAVGRARCPQPWQRMVVSRDGKVLPCCSDWYREYIIGDATKQSLTQIWRGGKMEDLRQVQRELKLDEITPCNHCFVKESYTWQRAPKGTAT